MTTTTAPHPPAEPATVREVLRIEAGIRAYHLACSVSYHAARAAALLHGAATIGHEAVVSSYLDYVERVGRRGYLDTDDGGTLPYTRYPLLRDQLAQVLRRTTPEA